VIAPLLALALAQAPAPAVRVLVPGVPIHDTLAGRESARFSIEVPADSAARVVVRQDGVDLMLTLRPEGAELIRGLDMRASVDGEEVGFIPVSTDKARWNVRVSSVLPQARRGGYEILLDLAPADEAARARAAAHARYQLASDISWAGDADSYRRAEDEYAAAAAAAADAGEPGLAAEATYQCGRIHDVLGDVPGAIEWQRRALDMFRAIARHDREARVLNRLGDLSRKVGEVVDAERFFREALALAREVDDPVTTADILNNSGLLMMSLGRAEEAIQQLQSAIPLAQEVDSASVEAALTLNIGSAYDDLGMYDNAIASYQRTYEIDVTRLKLPRRSARAQTALAEAYFSSGDRVAAADAINRALALYEESGDRGGLAEAQALDGRMRHASGDADRAIDMFARALPVLHEARNRLAEARILTTWAWVDIDRDDADAGLLKADEALQLARQIANPIAEQNALYVRALALRKQHRLEEATASIAAVTSGVETARSVIQRGELRTSYLATVRRYFDLHIDLLQQQGASAAAFEMSERARARSLLDGLAESRAKIRKGVDPELLARQRAVQGQLNAKENYRAQVALRDGQASARATALGRDIAGLLEEWNLIRAKIRGSSPAYSQLQAPEPTTLEQVQKTLLDAGSALVEYHLGSARSYAWVIDRTSITVHPLPAAGQIDKVARAYHELLSADLAPLGAADRVKRTARVATLGRRLAAMVWKPIESRVADRRLLVVADGVLHYVPFAALPRSTGEPLIVHNEVVYLPSASVLQSIRQRSRPIQARPAVAVFADPVFSKNDPRLTLERDTTASPQTRAANGELYGRLRFSRREAEAIGALAPRAFAALDFMAAKPTLSARDLRQYGILHFATHGSINTAQPELSGLVLSLFDPAGKPIDGFLRLHEIYNLDLDADLVVLSACRTALGREVHGEGLIGLTRGFMYAGAARVVSSVWNVDDRASALLMARFYEAMLTKGLSPASALRDAQLSLLRQPRWADPHYWAAFGIQGDWK
jgi:CHAT domain-containing protein/tetratricopeptide (TPR) repeat protein